MTIVRINAITVAPAGGDELKRRFETRSGSVDAMDGFEGFDLLRPTDGSNRYFVMTRWRDEEAFGKWISSSAFATEHARSAGAAPVATHSELLAFDVVRFG